MWVEEKVCKDVSTIWFQTINVSFLMCVANYAVPI